MPGSDEHYWTPPEDTQIFVVDDEEDVTGALVRSLEKAGYHVRGFTDPIEAKAAIEEESPALLITDKNMPGLDGIKLAELAIEDDPDISVVILTGAADVGSATSALRLGVADYLEKPAAFDELLTAVNRALSHRDQKIYGRLRRAWMEQEVEERTREARERADQLEAVTVAALSAMVRLLEASSDHFEGHSRAVSELAGSMAEALALPEEDVGDVRTAGLLHDIGMVSVPSTIIEKAGELDPEEFALVRKHTSLAEEILGQFPDFSRVVEYVVHHHERIDGSGYPDGLAGDEIPLGAQIVGVADAYRALVESRAFRDPIRPDEALDTLRGAEGVWYSSRMLDALESARGR